MEMRSHVLLAGYLLNDIPACHSVINQKAFILGCIEPDFNMFSYLKGSIKCQKLRGHNYNSSRRYTLRVIEHLQGRTSWTMRDYYRLGKLMHYLADAFTYPHNESYPGTLWEHRVYESHLHPHLVAELRRWAQVSVGEKPKDAGTFIAGLHEEYTGLPGNYHNDAMFIIQATSRVMRALAPAPAIVYKEGVALYENPDYNRLVCPDREWGCDLGIESAERAYPART